MDKVLYEQYVQYVLNKVTDLDERQQAFIEDLGAFFASYGVGAAPGRIYAYLLLRPELATLDEIAADLGISKSGASSTARQLETWNLVRRVHDRGSRRIRYEPTTEVDQLLIAGVAKVQAFRQTLEEGRQVAQAGQPTARLEQLSTALQLYLEAVHDALRRIREGVDKRR